MCGFWLLAAWGGDSFSQWPLREVAMARDGLFEDLPEQPGPERAAGRARLRESERDQIELRAVDLDSLIRSEEHTSELQSLMHISYAVFCLKKKKINSDHLKHLSRIYTMH